MSKQKAKQAKDGMSLSIFLGATVPQQINSLQEIKDAMVDILIQNQYEDCAFKGKTIDQIVSFYLLADNQVEQLLLNNTIN